VAGLDLRVRHDRTVLAIGHRAGDQVVLDRMVCWRGSRLRPVDFGEVESTIVQAHRRFHFMLWLDPWQGLDLAQRLRAQGVRVEEYGFTVASKQRLAASLLSLVNAGNLALYEAEGLREELLALRLVQTTSGAWALDHSSGGHDDRAVALALMAVAALERHAQGGAFLKMWRGELAGREADPLAGVDPVARRQGEQLPRFVPFERDRPAPWCEQRWSREASGEVCVFCHGWRDPGAA